MASYPVSFRLGGKETKMSGFLKAPVVGLVGMENESKEQPQAWQRYARNLVESNVSTEGAAFGAYATLRIKHKEWLTSVYTVPDTLLKQVHEAKKSGFRVRVVFDTYDSAGTIASLEDYLTEGTVYGQSVVAIVDAIETPRTITVNGVVEFYPGYSLDSLALESEPDVQWPGTEQELATFLVGALKSLKDYREALGQPVPKLGAGGWSSIREVAYWAPFFQEFQDQGITLDEFAVHAFDRWATLLEEFDYRSLVYQTARENGVDNEFVILVDGYGIQDYDPLIGGSNPALDDERQASYIAQWSVAAAKVGLVASVPQTHDEEHAAYTDDFTGKGNGLFLLYGAPKPSWFAMRFVSLFSDGKPVRSLERELDTRDGSWSVDASISATPDRSSFSVIATNAPRDLHERALDWLALERHGDGLLEDFLVALGAGIDYDLNGSTSAGSATHETWGRDTYLAYIDDATFPATPFTGTAYDGLTVTAAHIASFLDQEATANAPNGFTTLHPKWQDSIVDAHDDISNLRSTAADDATVTIYLEPSEGWKPLAVIESYLLDATNNRPQDRPEFDTSNPSSVYESMKADTNYDSLTDPVEIQARYDAIDLGTDPTYTFGNAGQPWTIPGVVSIDQDINAITFTLPPNSVVYATVSNSPSVTRGGGSTGTVQFRKGDILIDADGKRPIRIYSITPKEVVYHDFTDNETNPSSSELLTIDLTSAEANLIQGRWIRTGKIAL